jgi:hypothetical protein
MKTKAIALLIVFMILLGIFPTPASERRNSDCQILF